MNFFLTLTSTPGTYGGSHTCGKLRPKNLLADRMTRSKFHIKNISQLAKLNRKVRQLFTGSAFLMATWGHQAAAISDSRIIELEKDALACSGINPAERCRTSALPTAYGILGTPRARIYRETLRAWFDIIRNSSVEVHNQIRVAWGKAKEHMI